jgi:hypothetical protein
MSAICLFLLCRSPGEQLACLRLLRCLDLFDESFKLVGADFLARRKRLKNVHQEQLEADKFRECVLSETFFGPDSDRTR